MFRNIFSLSKNNRSNVSKIAQRSFSYLGTPGTASMIEEGSITSKSSTSGTSRSKPGSTSYTSHTSYMNMSGGQRLEYRSDLVYAWDVESAIQPSVWSTQYDLTAALNKRCQELCDEGWSIAHVLPFCNNACSEYTTTTHFVVVANRPKH